MWDLGAKYAARVTNYFSCFYKFLFGIDNKVS